MYSWCLLPWEIHLNRISSREMPTALDTKPLNHQSANQQFNSRAIILRFDPSSNDHASINQSFQQCHVPLSTDYWRRGYQSTLSVIHDVFLAESNRHWLCMILHTIAAGFCPWFWFTLFNSSIFSFFHISDSITLRLLWPTRWMSWKLVFKSPEPIRCDWLNLQGHGETTWHASLGL